MDYDWIKILDEGQRPIGYIEVYETTAENDIKIRAIITYYPDLNQFSKNRICNVTILFVCEKKDITDGFWHWVLDDITELISNQEEMKFDKEMKKFETMFTQQFFVKELPEMIYFTHGDYSKVTQDQ